jgi:hypothetical protein
VLPELLTKAGSGQAWPAASVLPKRRSVASGAVLAKKKRASVVNGAALTKKRAGVASGQAWSTALL